MQHGPGEAQRLHHPVPLVLRNMEYLHSETALVGVPVALNDDNTPLIGPTAVRRTHYDENMNCLSSFLALEPLVLTSCN